MTTRQTREIEWSFTGKDNGATATAEAVKKHIEATVASVERHYVQLQAAMLKSSRAAAAAAEAGVTAARAHAGGDQGAYLAAERRAARMATNARLMASKVVASTKSATSSLTDVQKAAVAEIDKTANEMVKKGVSASKAYAKAMADAKREASKPYRVTQAGEEVTFADMRRNNEAARAHRERAEAFGSQEVGQLFGLRSAYESTRETISSTSAAAIARATVDAQAKMSKGATSGASAFGKAARGYLSAMRQVGRGAVKMADGAITAVRRLYEAWRIAVRVAHTLARAVSKVAHALAHMASRAVHATVRLGTGFLKGTLHAVRELASELAHVVTLLGKIAVHKALQYGKRALVAYGAASALVTREGFKATSESNANVNETKNEAMTAGMSTGMYQSYVNAAKASGVDSKDVLRAFGHLEEEVHKAAIDPKSPQAEYLREMKVSMYRKDDNGRLQLRSTDDIFQEIASKQQNLTQDDRLALFEALFGGKEALKITPFLDRIGGGGDPFAAGQQRAETLGTIISPQDERAAQDYKQAIIDLKDAFSGLRMEISRRLTPAITFWSNIATGLVVNYRADIAGFVARHVQDLVHNAAQLLKVIDVETGLFAKIEAARRRPEQSGGLNPVLKGYFFWLQHLRRPLLNVLAIAKKVGHAFGAMLTRLDLRSFDGFVAGMKRLKEAMLGDFLERHNLDSFDGVAAGLTKVREGLERAVTWLRYYGKEFYQAVLLGDASAADDTPILQKLANVRNQVVAYLRQAIADIKSVWENGDDAGVETFVGRMAKRLLWLVENAPGWWEQIKRTVSEGVTFVKSLWTEFNVVLGKGPGERGTSSVFPFLNELVRGFDTLKERFESAVRILVEVYAALDKVFHFFGLDLGTTLLVLSLAKFTGVLGLAQGAFKIFGGVLAGILETIGLIATGLGEAGIAGGIMRVVNAVRGVGTAGAVAGRVGTGGAAAAGGLGLAEGAGAAVAGFATAAALPAAAVVGGFLGGATAANALNRFIDDETLRKAHKELAPGLERGYVQGTIADEVRRVREESHNYLVSNPQQERDAFDRVAGDSLSPKARGVANTLNIKIDGEHFGTVESDGTLSQRLGKMFDRKGYDLTTQTSTSE